MATEKVEITTHEDLESLVDQLLALKHDATAELVGNKPVTVLVHYRTLIDESIVKEVHIRG